MGKLQLEKFRLRPIFQNLTTFESVTSLKFEMLFVTSSRSRGKAVVKISSPRFQKRGATKENRREGKRKKGKAKN